jgi:hypothetical protein
MTKMDDQPVVQYERARPAAAVWWIAASFACAAYPFLMLACRYGSWIAGRIALGHWPQPNIDDPGNIVYRPLDFISGAYLLSLIAAPLVAMLNIGFAAAAMKQPTQRTMRLAVIAPAVAWGVAIVATLFDGLPVFEWLLD